VEHFQHCSLDTCFGEQVRTTLLHPYGTAVEQMRGTLAVQCCTSVFSQIALLSTVIKRFV